MPPTAPIGAEWLDDGSTAGPEFEEIARNDLSEQGYVVGLLYGPDGYQIWLAAVVDDSGEFPRLRLDDAVAVELTELTAFVLGATPCTIDGQPANGVVGVFLWDDLPELVDAVGIWVVDDIQSRLIPTDAPVACANEGFGV